MKKGITLLSLFWCIVSYAHDFDMSIFTLPKENNQLKIEVSFDRKKIETELAFINTSSVKQYIKRNSSWFVNHKKIDFSSFTISVDEDTVKVKAYTKEVMDSKITHLEIWNQNLVNKIDSHINIINIKLNNKHRSFKMNKNRKKINVSY